MRKCEVMCICVLGEQRMYDDIKYRWNKLPFICLVWTEILFEDKLWGSFNNS